MRLTLNEIFDSPLKLTQEIGSIRKVFSVNHPQFDWFQIFTCKLDNHEYLIYNARENGFYRIDFELIDLKKADGLQNVKDIPVRIFSTIIHLYEIHIKNNQPIRIYAHDSKYFDLYKRILVKKIDQSSWIINYRQNIIECKPIGKIHGSVKSYKEIMEAIRCQK